MGLQWTNQKKTVILMHKVELKITVVYKKGPPIILLYSLIKG